MRIIKLLSVMFGLFTGLAAARRHSSLRSGIGGSEGGKKNKNKYKKWKKKVESPSPTPLPAPSSTPTNKPTTLPTGQPTPPPTAEKPFNSYDTGPEGWCLSDLNEELAPTTSAEACWAQCAGKYPDTLISIDWYPADGGECYCQDSCDCMVDVGNDEPGAITLIIKDMVKPEECPGCIAVGEATSISSLGGDMTWTAVANSPLAVGSGVAWNGEIWIAVGEATSIATSNDGVTWTAVANSPLSVGSGVTWNGVMWVAVGEPAGTLDSSIATSSDGVTWTAVPDSPIEVGLGVACKKSTIQH